jgi:CubicO group peptidase (beta-lactamase class C family)
MKLIIDTSRHPARHAASWKAASMRGQRALALAALLAAAGYSQQASAQSSAEIKKLVDAYIPTLLSAQDPSGVAVVVRSAGQSYFFNYGYANAATHTSMSQSSVQTLGTASSLFTSLMLSAAVNAGTVKLDDKVSTYIPELKAGADISTVTLGMLASHSSGLPAQLGPQARSEAGLLKFLASWQRQPAQQPASSGTDDALLRLALERAQGKSYPLQLAAISTALHMAHTTQAARVNPAALVQAYDTAGQPATATGSAVQRRNGGSVFSNTADMAALAGLAMDQITSESATATASPRMPLAATPTLRMGMQQQLPGATSDLIYDKAGDAPFGSAYLGVRPGQDLSVVMLANRGGLPLQSTGRAILNNLVPMINQQFNATWPSNISPDGLWRINGPWTGTGGNEMDPTLAVISPTFGQKGGGFISLTSAANQKRGSEIQTLKGYGYGYYETRLQVTSVPGVCDSFFWIESPNYGPHEWDIEFLTNESWITSPNSGQVHLTLHPSNSTFVLPLGFNPSKGIHRYGFLWTAGQIVFTVDGKAAHTFTESDLTTSATGFIMANTWTGNPNWGGGPPTKNATSTYAYVKFAPGATTIPTW